MNDVPMLIPGRRVATELNADDISLLISALDGSLPLFDSADQRKQVDTMVSRLVCLFEQIHG